MTEHLTSYQVSSTVWLQHFPCQTEKFSIICLCGLWPLEGVSFERSGIFQSTVTCCFTFQSGASLRAGVDYDWPVPTFSVLLPATAASNFVTYWLLSTFPRVERRHPRAVRVTGSRGPPVSTSGHRLPGSWSAQVWLVMNHAALSVCRAKPGPPWSQQRRQGGYVMASSLFPYIWKKILVLSMILRHSALRF